MKLTIMPIQYVENGRWFVEACINLDEILEDKKLKKFFIEEMTEEFVNVQFRDDFVPLNEFIRLLKNNKRLYKEYRGFVKWAKQEQDCMQRVAMIMFENAMMVKTKGKNAKYYMRKELSKEIFDLVDYLSDRATKEDLDVNEMASIIWERFIEGFVALPYEE